MCGLARSGNLPHATQPRLGNDRAASSRHPIRLSSLSMGRVSALLGFEKGAHGTHLGYGLAATGVLAHQVHHSEHWQVQRHHHATDKDPQEQDHDRLDSAR